MRFVLIAALCLATSACVTDGNQTKPSTAATAAAPAPAKTADSGPILLNYDDKQNLVIARNLYGIVEPFMDGLTRCMIAKAHGTALRGKELATELRTKTAGECRQFMETPLLFMSGWNNSKPRFGYSDQGMEDWLGIAREVAASVAAEQLQKGNGRPLSQTELDRLFEEAKQESGLRMARSPYTPPAVAKQLEEAEKASKPYVLTYKDVQAKTAEYQSFNRIMEVLLHIRISCANRAAREMHAGSSDVRLIVDASLAACSQIFSRTRSIMMAWAQADGVRLKPSTEIATITANAMDTTVREKLTQDILKLKAGSSVRLDHLDAQEEARVLDRTEKAVTGAL